MQKPHQILFSLKSLTYKKTNKTIPFFVGFVSVVTIHQGRMAGDQAKSLFFLSHLPLQATSSGGAILAKNNQPTQPRMPAARTRGAQWTRLSTHKQK
jgi:hypothetical protein